MMNAFELIRDEQVAELKSRVRLYRHRKTGAELMSVENDDENKVFGITFRTPPSDSTGVAHILEHSVLCGSKKFPVKEPFVELLKGSLQTFLNAWTFPDKTSYPVASQNLQDFYNLVEIYLDAAFNPLLSRETHAQEAWHYELEQPDAPLIYKGVVFNEMKGVYSSPDSALCQYGQESLFPDITYGLDYGGDPRYIPDLSYEQLCNFHRRYYHPSNSRIYFYGDDDPAKRLELMARWMEPYERLAIDSTIPLQPRFTAPREVTRKYPASKDPDARAMVVTSWLLTDATDLEHTLAFEVLTHVLIGTPASPLRKALIDSGLGEDLAGVGYENQLRQTYFSTGLKGVALPDLGKVEALVLQTLEKLAADGLDPRTVEASLNTLEFKLRENNTGSYPRGLGLMVRSLGSWLYDGDPIAPLRFEAPLARIKDAAKNGFLEQLIRRHFLENPHRATLRLVPDAGLTAELESREKERLAEARSRMSPDQLNELVRLTAALKKRQETPDSPEALATLPQLKLKDLDRKNKSTPLSEEKSAGVPVIFHDLFTQGIIYLDLGFDLAVLPQEYIPLAPLYAKALLEMGTQKEDFVSLSQRIGSQTGGIEEQLFTSAVRGGGPGIVKLFIRGKAMTAQGGAITDILKDILTLPRFDQRERFKQIVLEEKASLESSLVPSGHSFVMTRLRAGYNDADWAAEQTRGISQLFFLRRLAERIENDWASVRGELEAIHRLLVNRSSMLVNLTCDGASWAAFQPALAGLLDSLPCFTTARVPWLTGKQPAAEGLSIPSQVNYVGMVNGLHQLGYQLNGSGLVVTRYLRSAYLWDRVRVQGGAYGGFCNFDIRSGLLCFVSYRDPNFEKTLDIYRGTAAYLRTLHMDDDELTKAIVGAIGDMDQYMLPDARGFLSLTRRLCGDDPAFRQKLRDEVLATTLEDFRRMADVFERYPATARSVVLGAEDAIQRDPSHMLTKVL